MSRDTIRTLTALRRAARTIAVSHHLTAEHRGRLVVSLAHVAAGALERGRLVRLTARSEAAASGADRLVVTLRLPRSAALPRAVDPGRLPLPGQRAPDGTVVWTLPVQRPAVRNATGAESPAGAGPPGARPPAACRPTASPATAPEADRALADEELRAALGRADALAAEHRRLEHELAQTNSGVLALYVQLDERDQQLRRAHGQALRALEDALRPRPLHVDGLELAVHYAPAYEEDPTGGDLYDWFTLPDGSVHITVVDALGHGVAGTRTALAVIHAVRTLALEGHSLESIVERTDRVLAPVDHDVMATVLLARVDPATRELRLANGSHPPALLVRADGTGGFLEVRGRGIGYPKPGSEGVLSTTLAPGDLLVLYTDGLTESRRSPIEGERILLRAARRHRGEPTAGIPRNIATDILTDVLHPDDTLALAVRLTG